MVDRLESFALASVANLVPEEVNGSTVDLFVHKQTANVEMYVEQRSVSGLRQEQMASMPSDRPRKLDSVQCEEMRGKGEEKGGKQTNRQRDRQIGS